MRKTVHDVTQLWGAIALKESVRGTVAAVIHSYVSILLGNDSTHDALLSSAWVALGEKSRRSSVQPFTWRSIAESGRRRRVA